MIVKTRAILLHHVRYSDNSLIAHFYTREYGRLPVMVKGISSKKGSTKYPYFQPLHIFNLELYHYENREIHNLKELNLSYIPGNIPGDIRRSSIALFMGELLNNIIREEDVNLALYSFIETSVISLDEMTEGISNFHLWFLVTLTAYAGLGPTPSSKSGSYFDMASGQFTPDQPMHPDYLEPYSAGLLNRLLMMTAGELAELHLTGEERSELLNRVLKYYQLHLPGIRHIRSLQVLKEIFR
ncbi:MAG: DNA repair protein RecO [Bacteroidales bacterium]|nr:DNA repair protein RecO [Bacteroidales bacterium]